MQRLKDGDAQAPVSLTPANGTGYYVPGGYAAVPGQTLLPTAVTRAWPTLAELVNALKRRMVLATFLGILIGMAAAAAVWLAMPSGKHQVKALVQMKPYQPIVGKSGPDGEFESYKQTQMKLMRTRTLLQRVVSDPQVSRLSLIQTSDDPVRMIDEQIRMRWESPELLEVSMQGDEPPQLQIIINKLLEMYLDDASVEERKQRAKQRAEVERMKEQYTKEIDQITANLKNLQRLGGGLSEKSNQLALETATEELKKILAELHELKKKTLDLETELEADTKKLAAVKATPITLTELQKALSTNPTVTRKVEERDRLLAEIKELLSQVMEDSPIIVGRRTKLNQLEAELKKLLEEQRPSIEAALIAAREGELQARIVSRTDDLAKTKAKTTKNESDRKGTEEKISNLNQASYATLESDDLKLSKANLAKVQLELYQLNVADHSLNRITVREKAEPVINQNLRQKLLLSGAAALIAATLIAISVAFLEWRSRRVDSVDQIVNELGVRVIGTIPAFPSKASLRSGDAATNQNWRFVLNESVNSTRTMLLHAAKTQNMQVLMVTSAMQGEGKTSFASQLATSMATAGMRTLILDTDLRNPSLHKLFDAPLTPGCSEVLCQEVDVSDAVQPTTIPNLWLIPAGQCSNRVISALAQGHPLESLFNRLRGQFDFIVVDSCPILPVADALLVGQHVDGVVLSVLQDISQLPKVQTASEKLTQLNIPLLGAVVNGIKPDVHAYGYNYVKQLPA